MIITQLMVSQFLDTQELGGLPEARPEDLVFSTDGTFVKKVANGATEGIPPATYKFRLYSGKVGHTLLSWLGGLVVLVLIPRGELNGSEETIDVAEVLMLNPVLTNDWERSRSRCRLHGVHFDSFSVLYSIHCNIHTWFRAKLTTNNSND